MKKSKEIDRIKNIEFNISEAEINNFRQNVNEVSNLKNKFSTFETEISEIKKRINSLIDVNQSMLKKFQSLSNTNKNVISEISDKESSVKKSNKLAKETNFIQVQSKNTLKNKRYKKELDKSEFRNNRKRHNLNNKRN